MIWVLYRSDGSIAQAMQCGEVIARTTAAAMGLDCLPVSPPPAAVAPDHYDARFRVANGALVERAS